MNIIDHAKPSIESAYEDKTFLYFDIETIPTQNDDVRKEVVATLEPPSNYKKPEVIEKWKADNAVRAVEKTSFDGGLGHVCTIAYAKNNGEIEVTHARKLSEEYDILSTFFETMDQYHSETLVGHNIAGFDIPFLTKRAIVLGVQIPHTFPRNPTAWDKSINDTMSMWGGREMIGMDRLCHVLGFEGKDDFDGSMVADAWAAGLHSKIAKYAADDVARTRAIHQRFLSVGW